VTGCAVARAGIGRHRATALAASPKPGSPTPERCTEEIIRTVQREPFPQLTPHDAQVLDLLAAGLSYSAIAYRLR
jgi:DNA-binding NarL/FixJ family response regulator